MAEQPHHPAAPCWSNVVKQSSPNKPREDLPVVVPNGAAVGNCKSSKGIAVAVLDANAIIQGGEGLGNIADKFVSVAEVMNEVRDPTSRHRLNFIPFTVQTMEPSPESLKTVISFSRATGDLQTLSDVDLKLIALTHTLEAQIHGTKHLRDSPPPIYTVNVKRLPEKDMPGWGSNVPNLEEWEALDHQGENASNPDSRILPLKDLNLNVLSTDHHSSAEDVSMGNGSASSVGNPEDASSSFEKPRRYFPKKEINIEEKKMVADGIDACQGQYDDNADDWRPAVSRSTHRRYLRRKARREMFASMSEEDGQQDKVGHMGSDSIENRRQSDQLTVKNSDKTHNLDAVLEGGDVSEGQNIDEELSSILNQVRLEEDSLRELQEGNEPCAGPEPNNSMRNEAVSGNGDIRVEGDDDENFDEGLEHVEISSQNTRSLDASLIDDNSTEQSWMLRSLSESTVACVTSDFAMQNVLLQMGLRLLAPGGMQIHQLHRWILKCHACFKVTTEIGRIFCPSCGNGGTLRKVAVTVGENGIVVAARRPRISLRGTKFSLPLPQGGRDAITKNPVLREDQLPRKFLYPKTKKKNKKGDDIFTPDDIFSHHSTDKRAPLQPPVRKALAVFSGKRNPNDNHFARPKH